jgi:hypothetical protein
MKVNVKKPRDYEKVASCAAQALGEEKRDFSFYKEAMEHEIYQWPQQHAAAMSDYCYQPEMFNENVFLDAATFQPEKYLMDDKCVWEEGIPQPTDTIQLASKSVRRHDFVQNQTYHVKIAHILQDMLSASHS